MKDERVKLPKFILYFMYIYFGITSVMLLTGQDFEKNIAYKIIWIVALSGYTALAAYGLISLIEDIRKRGYGFIVRKIRRFFKV